MNEKIQLMNRIQVCTFNLDELTLFLDTHPSSTEAMELFTKYRVLMDEAVAKYIKKFGPLSATDYDGSGKWKWVDSPWPWELKEVQ